jgi:hypothetical protein
MTVTKDTYLEEQLSEHWPLNRVVVTCDECGDVLYDTNENTPFEYSPSVYETAIRVRVSFHHEECGHKSVTVDIEKDPEITMGDFDVTVEVDDD